MKPKKQSNVYDILVVTILAWDVLSKMGEIRRPSWNSRWRPSDTIDNDAIRFTVIENMGIAVQIMILSIIDFKL